jgi:TatA/E family protein of Tat protein translocase
MAPARRLELAGAIRGVECRPQQAEVSVLPNIGPLELVLVLAIALLVIGPGKLPQVAKSLGEAMREFRKVTTEVQEATKLDLTPAAPATPAAAPATPAPAPVPASASAPQATDSAVAATGSDPAAQA